MKRKFIFDVDGTLTPSRQKIDPSFKDFLANFMHTYPVYFVTGSDKPKTVQQLGEDIFNKAVTVFNCSGNEVWIANRIIHKTDWQLPQEVEDYLKELLEKSKFQTRTGNHIEKRTGCVNFSIVGRNADMEQREEYKSWDHQTSEREHIAEKINHKFENIDAVIGGETGIDIFEKGKDKRQCVEKIRTSDDDVLYYFGDQIKKGGNDYTIAKKCDHYYQVNKWEETYEILKYLYDVEEYL